MKFPVKHPVVLGTITTAAGLKLLGRANVADAVEVRVDALLAEKVAVEKIEKALKARRRPVLLTLRIPAEGGHRAWKLAERRELFLRLLPEVEAIDLELATVGKFPSVVEAARRSGKTLVLSAHAIARPATAAQMSKWVAGFESFPGAILKVAGRIKSWRDLQRLAALLIDHPEWKVAVMGLGPYAAQSRSVLTALGSRLVYGHLDRAAAPGQPSAAEVRAMVRAVQVPAIKQA
jgi:3-dehydroquinate dehydratase-1